MKKNDEREPQIFEEIGKEAGEGLGRAIAGVATAAAASAMTSAAAGSAVPLTVGSTIAPYVSALGAAKVTSIPAVILFMANPVGAAVVSGALIGAGAAAGGKFLKWLLK